jgi:hypothetical protein
VAGLCELSNELSDSVEGGEFFLLAERLLASQKRLNPLN